MPIGSETLAAASLPFDEALRFFAQKTNVPTHKWTDLWGAAHARAFSVAGATRDGLITDFRDAIDKAKAEGTTLAEFRSDFDAIVAKHGWEHRGSAAWRSRVIYETNLSMAFAAGRHEQMTEPVNLAVFPYWRYRHSGNPHPRLQHLAWDGQTFDAEDPWWEEHYPPNGFFCGCWVEPLMWSDLKRIGKSGPDKAPPTEMVKTMLKDGTVVETPMGVQPGFGYNVGTAWKQPLPVEGRFKAERAVPPAPKLPQRGE
jgi:uncharacterized protein with gpF-like domain